MSTKQNFQSIKTLGELRKSNYTSRSIKQELRENLIEALKNKTSLFKQIRGFEESVIPQLETAILSQHNILLLGLRGQAKTRLSRMMVNLLDEFIPVVEGSEMNEDPLNPISKPIQQLIFKAGDDTPISWMHRDDRYVEKLATPDVSVADLIGDLDPIKAASLKLNYADERVIHYGLVPRSNRCIFVINELPDLQARIQVALFNILQEGDIQIRGFRVRLPIDLQFVFTANPEDYTNRGSIVTPLKDRIGSQILTHYPKTVEISQAITKQEARISSDQKDAITISPLVEKLLEQISFEARASEYIDQKSGVSARLTIAAYENLHSVIHRRILINGEKSGAARISDLYGIIPAITGKVELVYEGELEGISNVAYTLIGKTIRNEFVRLFPDPERTKKSKQPNPYKEVLDWFADGNEVDLVNNSSEKDFEAAIKSVNGLEALVKSYHKNLHKAELLLMQEFVLHGLSEFSQISKRRLEGNVKFSDLVGSIFNPGNQE